MVLAMVEDITREKRQTEQLRKAQKMEALGLLAGGVAHDLNNILSGIVSYPELVLLDLEAESPLREPLLAIKSSGEKAAEIVQDLLTLARRGVAYKKILDLNHVVKDFIASPAYRKILAGHPRIRVALDLAADLLNLSGSAVHLSKTVMNLVANAAEAMPGGGEIVIRTANRYNDKAYSGFEQIPEGEYTVLEVADAGIGIRSADLEHIFEPFYTKKAMGRSGSGLGMAVVWGTLHDHDGYIDVETEEGRGTTFRLFFPVTRLAKQREARITIDDYIGRGESILVVDDAPEQRSLAERMLQRLGYTVSSADSGQEALALLREQRFDLVVLDMIMLPGWDGLETYRGILEINPRQKAVIASGFSENDRVREMQRLGAGPYVRKPYTLEKIGLAVRRELDRPVHKAATP
jgi:nitrogen-specific signal transduction histidine kinase/ActR/RegA family two-component response regulator